MSEKLGDGGWVVSTKIKDWTEPINRSWYNKWKLTRPEVYSSDSVSVGTIESSGTLWESFGTIWELFGTIWE